MKCKRWLGLVASVFPLLTAIAQGSGTVTSVTVASPKSTVTVTNPTVTTSGTIDIDVSAMSGDVATSSGSLVTTIQAGAVTLAKQAALAADSIVCNNTNGATTPIACTPLQMASLISAKLAVAVVCDVNCLTALGLSGTGTTLPSGLQTVDGMSLTNGQTVLITGYSSTSAYLNGIFVVSSSGTWTRAPFFIGTIAQNCDVAVFVRYGTNYGGDTFVLSTSSASIPIGTASSAGYQNWTLSQAVAYGPSTGLYYLAGNGSGSASIEPTPVSTGSAAFLQLFGGTTPEGPGGGISLSVLPANTAIAASYSGGGLILTAGQAVGSANGGATTIVGGQGPVAGSGISGNGGPVTIQGGNAHEGNGGGINLIARAGATATSTARNGGNVSITPGPAVSGGTPGVIFLNGAVVAGGTKFTVASGTGACATTSTTIGGAIAGSFLCTGTAGASSATLTLPSSTSGWYCNASDSTSAVVWASKPVSTTSATITGNIATTNDKVSFACMGF